MTNYHRKFITVLAMFSAVLTSGCALWPSLTADKNLDPATATNIPCITTDYDDARKCALLTINELSEMLGDTGDFDRAAAFALLGIGTAAGTVLAFNGSENLLKGLAVGTGSIFGLNTVVNPDAQRAALKAGLKDMVCALRAADALVQSIENLRNTSPGRVLTISSYNATTRLATFQAPAGISAKRQGIIEADRLRIALKFEGLSNSGSKLITAMKSADKDAAAKLSAAVVAIRAEVREKLAEAVPNLEDLAKEQRERVVDLVGEVVRRRAELEDKDKDAGQGENPAEEILSQDAKKYIAETSIVASVFRDCVDPATQRAVENN